MSKQNLKKSIVKELDVLNDQIDQKIIKGLPYGKEARRHKFLLQSLSSLREKDQRSSWLSRSISLVSTFVF